MNSRKLYQWVRQESKQWTEVTRHFQENVVVFSRSVIRSQSSQLRRIAGCSEGKADSQRRRLQRFVAGQHELGGFFKNWSQTVVRTWKPQVMVLVVDETKLKDELGVMVVGMVYEGRCIPLAWRVYRANDASAYPAEGQVEMVLSLLKHIRAGLPRGQRVRVLADRGIGTSPSLMRGILALGWTFLFRVTRMSKIVLADGSAVAFHDQVQHRGHTYAASGLVFKRRGRIPAHVRVLWQPHATQPWALVTNDPTLTGWEYAKRMSIELMFRDFKSFGWQLELANLHSPARLERLLIFLVVAYAWLLLWGNSVVSSMRRQADGLLVRRWSLFRHGRQAFLLSHPFF